MKRRRFLAASGTALLGTTAFQSIKQPPSIALNFEIVGVENKQPSNVSSVVIKFENFELIPKHMDESTDLKIKINLSIEQEGSKHTISNAPFKNGQKITSSDLGSAVPIIKDGINSTKNTLRGTIKIKIEHADISDLYKQSFTIDGYSEIKATGGDRTYKLVDQGNSVKTESQLELNESLDDYKGRKYKVHVFNSVGKQEFDVNKIGENSEVEALLVGGGGGGGEGGGLAASGGGGGSGGVVHRSISVQQQTYEITVGKGGQGGLANNSPTLSGKGVNGDNSKAFGLTALGGGGGGGTGEDSDGKSGGSGGGGGGQVGKKGKAQQSSSTTGGHGKDGGDGNPSNLGGSGDDVGGGGGGAGDIGQDASDFGPAGDGGEGAYYGDKFGETIGESGQFAGGGGGAVPNYYNTNDAGNGALGGGGDGGKNGGGKDGQVNTGGGGGGGDGQRAGDGGSGIVLVTCSHA